MNQETPVSFMKERDFGQTINATFLFFKQNFKPLFTCLCIYALPFAVLSTLLVSLLDLHSVFNIKYTTRSTLNAEEIIYKAALLILIFSVFLLSLSGTVYSYCALYIERGPGNFTHNDVGNRLLSSIWVYIKTFLFFIIVFGIIVLLMAGLISALGGGIAVLGVIVLFVVLIYFMYCFFSIFAIQIIEKLSLFEAIDRSMRIIKGSWWRTFAVLTVLSIIVSMMSSMVQMLLGVVFRTIDANTFNPLAEVGPTEYQNVMSTAISSACSILFQPLIIVATVMHYFSLVDKKEKHGLMAEIENIGRTEESSGNEEQNPFAGRDEHY